jgi:hypothetical protein
VHIHKFRENMARNGGRQDKWEKKGKNDERPVNQLDTIIWSLTVTLLLCYRTKRSKQRSERRLKSLMTLMKRR